MSKSKFGGIIIAVNHFANGGCAILTKVVTENGQVNEPTMVDIKREDAELIKALQANGGLETGAQITFEATRILEWQDGVDRLLPAKGQYPAQPIHNLYGYTPGSLSVTRWVKGKEMVAETDTNKIAYARRLSFATMMDSAIEAAKSALGFKRPEA
jgi:hypothetical protein